MHGARYVDAQRTLHFMNRFCLFSIVLLAGFAQAQDASAPFGLDLPLQCTPGKDCWIANYVDLDKGPGARDYTCGELSYNDHNGTDFALRDQQAMREGMPVLAAADGVVRATRDGVADVSVRERGLDTVDGRECGNAVVLDHSDGWQTQYCHMRRGSVAVKRGDKVTVHDRLGLVGMSGETEYPHLHMIVRKQKTVVDPFQGLVNTGQCGMGKMPLWKTEVLESLPYAPGAIYNYGFASAVLKPEDVRKGSYRSLVMEANAPLFAVWAEVFAVTAGDVLELSLAGPDGVILLQRREVLNKRQARIFRLAARKRSAAPWPTGEYHATISLKPKAGDRQKNSVSFTAVVP